MNDDPPLTARRPKPPSQNGTPSAERRRPPGAPPRKAAAPQPKESRLIGYLVLGFGAAALIAVMAIWLSGRHAGPPVQTVATTATPQTLIKDISAAPAPAQAVKTSPAYARQPSLDIGDLQGNWQASIGKYTAVLQIQKGVYQIIMAQPDPNAARLYSSGEYKSLEDLILLVPRLDWPAPVTPGARFQPAYDMITRAPFPVLASFQGGRLVWQNPPQSEKRVLVPYRMPLVGAENTDYIVWDKLR